MVKMVRLVLLVYKGLPGVQVSMARSGLRVRLGHGVLMATMVRLGHLVGMV